MSKIKLIVGLGNPSQQYANTRHNAGFWFVERIANDFNISLSLEKSFMAWSVVVRCMVMMYDCCYHKPL